MAPKNVGKPTILNRRFPTFYNCPLQIPLYQQKEMTLPQQNFVTAKPINFII